MTDGPRTLVSVIVPTHNRAHLLIGALDSVWAQTYRPIELIVVDDGSTDNTRAAVEAWQSAHCSDDRFTLEYVAQENRGPAVARNRGLTLSRGEYVQFLDSDDRLHPEKLAAQAYVLDGAPQFDAVVARVAFLDAMGRNGWISEIPGRQGDEELACFLCINDVPIHAPLHRRQLVAQSGGFDESLLHSEDVDLHFRLALAGARFGFMSEVLAWILHRADRARVSRRLSAAGPDFERDFYLRLLACGVRQGTATPALRQALAERLVLIARRYYGSLRPRTARACLEAAREVWPDSRPFPLRLYLSPGGSALGVVAEASIRVLRSARRGLLAALRMSVGSRGHVSLVGGL